MKVVAIGHSHLMNFVASHAALAKRNEAEFDLIPVHLVRGDHPPVTMPDGTRRLNPAAVAEVRRVLDEERPDALVMLLQGNQAATVALKNRVFDFVEPEDADESQVNASVAVLPYDLVLDYFESIIGQTVHFLRENAEVFPARRFAVAHPPPPGDDAFVLEHLKDSPIHAGVQAKGLPPAAFRARVWRASLASVRQLYARHDVPMLAPPAEVFTDEGCLAPEYFDDAVHANQAYYSLVQRQVADAIRNH